MASFNFFFFFVITFLLKVPRGPVGEAEDVTCNSKDSEINVANHHLRPCLLSSSYEQLQTVESKETMKILLRKLLIRDPGSGHGQRGLSFSS